MNLFELRQQIESSIPVWVILAIIAISLVFWGIEEFKKNRINKAVKKYGYYQNGKHLYIGPGKTGDPQNGKFKIKAMEKNNAEA